MSADLKRISEEVEPTDSDRNGWQKGTKDEEDTKDRQQLRGQRLKFANWFAWLAAGWLVFVAIVTVVALFGPVLRDPDYVLRTILGASTVHVLGPAYLLAKYLFGKPAA